MVLRKANCGRKQGFTGLKMPLLKQSLLHRWDGRELNNDISSVEEAKQVFLCKELVRKLASCEVEVIRLAKSGGPWMGGEDKSGRHRALGLAGTTQQGLMTICHHGSPLHDRLTDSCLARFVKRCVSMTRMQAASRTGDWLAIVRVLAKSGLHQHVFHAREFSYEPGNASCVKTKQ